MNLDRTFCASPTHNGCGRQLSPVDKKYAEEIGHPILWGYFCGEQEKQEINTKVDGVI